MEMETWLSCPLVLHSHLNKISDQLGHIPWILPLAYVCRNQLKVLLASKKSTLHIKLVLDYLYYKIRNHSSTLTYQLLVIYAKFESLQTIMMFGIFFSQ